MKNAFLTLVLLGFAGTLFAQELKEADGGAPAECSLPADSVPKAQAPAQTAPQAVFESRRQAKKAFKKRRKQIRKLVKKYRKASAQEKPAVKAQLYAVVSEGMDKGLAGMKARLAEEQANLDRWNQKLAQEEARWPEIKAQQVEDLLSGAAERKYKLARKAWKQELKAARLRLR